MRDGLLRMEEYVGCEGWALVAIAETAALDVWKQEEQRNGKLNDEAIVKRKQHVEGVLRDGQRRLDERCSTQETQPQRIIQNFYRSRDPIHLVKQTAATHIWAHAAQMYLAIVTLGWHPDKPSVRERASEVLRLLQKLDDPAILRSAVWPFCVAGCVSDVSRENGFRDLVAASGSLQFFGRLGDAPGILESVWSRRRELGVEWNMAVCFGIMGSPSLLL